MNELIAHLFGDYILQDHWQANAKRVSTAAAAIHAALYTLSFIFITRHPLALLVIFGTHFLIDHFCLANYWRTFWGVGQAGWFYRHVGRYVDRWDANNAQRKADAQLVRDCIKGPMDSCPGPIGVRGPAGPAPESLVIMLAIIVDNTFHLLINHLAIAYL